MIMIYSGTHIPTQISLLTFRRAFSNAYAALAPPLGRHRTSVFVLPVALKRPPEIDPLTAAHVLS